MKSQKIMKINRHKESGQLRITIPQGYNLFDGDFLSFTLKGDSVEIKKVII